MPRGAVVVNDTVFASVEIVESVIVKSPISTKSKPLNSSVDSPRVIDVLPKEISFAVIRPSAPIKLLASRLVATKLVM